MLRCWIENPVVTGPSCERPELVIVAPSDPLETAKPRRPVGCGSAPLWTPSPIHLAHLDRFYGGERHHDSRAWKRVQ